MGEYSGSSPMGDGRNVAGSKYSGDAKEAMKYLAKIKILIKKINLLKHQNYPYLILKI